MKVFFLVFILLTPLVFPQKVYNYIGRSVNKLSIPHNAQINRYGEASIEVNEDQLMYAVVGRFEQNFSFSPKNKSK